MTACSSRDPMIPRRSASQLSTSISPVWQGLGSGFKVDSRWRGAGSRRYSFVCTFVVMGMLNEAQCRQEYEVSYVIMYISIHWLEFCLYVVLYITRLYIRGMIGTVSILRAIGLME